MDILQEARELSKKTFFTHVFSTTDDGKSELINVIQYAILGVIPVIVLNKLIQRFIPEADLDKSSVELLVEIFLQILVMFCGIIFIHRTITYIPTYSGFNYEAMNFTNVILAFLVIILSIQSKLGIKTNIIYDRCLELWNGPSTNDVKKKMVKKNVRFNESMVQSQHMPSQADNLDENPQFLALPESTGPRGGQEQQHQQQQQDDYGGMGFGPQAANGLLGGSFGSLF
jgi:hypothetical protein